MQRPLTRKQRVVLDTISRLAESQGYMPSVREIGRSLGLSAATVHFHLVALEERGYLDRGGAFGIRLTRAAHQALTRGGTAQAPAEARAPVPIDLWKGGGAARVPVVGAIAAGEPLVAFEEHDEWVELPREVVRGRGDHRRCFALRVRGWSMRDDGIFDGDLVVVRAQEEIRDGEIAVVLLDGDTATLKRVYREADGRMRLQPANSEMKPRWVEADRIRIQGRIIGLLRRY